METLKSETKKRVLPSWMTAQVVEKRLVPAKTPKRKRTAEPARTARCLAVKTVYCMNEAEMVDVALGILLEGHAWEKPQEELAVGGTEKASSALLAPGPLTQVLVATARKRTVRMTGPPWVSALPRGQGCPPLPATGTPSRRRKRR